MRGLTLLASLAMFAAISSSPIPAAAADFTAFRLACAGGGAFLLGDVPDGTNAQPILDALCPCLEAGFASYTQPEVDALEADLRTGTNDEAKAKFPASQELQAKASGTLRTCFASDAVMSAATAAGL